MFAITSEFWQQSLQNRGRETVVAAFDIEEVDGYFLKKTTIWNLFTSYGYSRCDTDRGEPKGRMENTC